LSDTAECIQQGERYAKSPMTGNYYRVTKWERITDERIKSLEKEIVDRDEVPQEWLEVLDDVE
jgi:hypothetical protein